MIGPGGLAVPAQSQGLNLGNKKVSDLISTDVKVTIDEEKVTVTGTVHKVTGWTEFSTDQADGHFFPFLMPEACKKKNITVKGRTAGDRTVEMTDDLLLVIRLENLKEDKMQIFMDGDLLMDADFTGVTKEGS